MRACSHPPHAPPPAQAELNAAREAAIKSGEPGMPLSMGGGSAATASFGRPMSHMFASAIGAGRKAAEVTEGDVAKVRSGCREGAV